MTLTYAHMVADRMQDALSTSTQAGAMCLPQLVRLADNDPRLQKAHDAISEHFKLCPYGTTFNKAGESVNHVHHLYADVWALVLLMLLLWSTTGCLHVIIAAGKKRRRVAEGGIEGQPQQQQAQGEQEQEEQEQGEQEQQEQAQGEQAQGELEQEAQQLGQDGELRPLDKAGMPC